MNDNGNKAIADYIEEVKSTANENSSGLFGIRFPMPDGIWEQGNGWAGVEWCSENWGTKWDVSLKSWEPIVFEEESASRLHIVFDTAWSPPVKYVLRLSEQLPDVRFELAYAEQGMGFAGTQIIVNGEVVEETALDDMKYDKSWAEHMSTYKIRAGG